MILKLYNISEEIAAAIDLMNIIVKEMSVEMDII